MKKLTALLGAFLLTLPLAACGGDPTPPQRELTVFAAASMTETLDALMGQYTAANDQVSIVASYASSGDLLTQIQAGAVCDLFLSAAPTQMNALEAEGLLLDGTRRDLLENKVVLAVPAGNPRGLSSFDQLVERLGTGDILLAVGNSDVPVGQYTQKMFTHYGLAEGDIAGALTYGSNAKEVTTHISEQSVDGGVIYATDAFSAGLEVVDEATDAMCGQVLYPAAVLRGSAHPQEATAFLDYLSSDEAGAVFAAVGFTPLS